MATEVWTAEQDQGLDEPRTDIGIASSADAAKRLCEEYATARRAFLAPPVRPVRLDWRSKLDEWDDEDDGRYYANHPDDPRGLRPFMVTRREVKD